MRTRSDLEPILAYQIAPSGLIRVWELTQGKPWAKLSCPFGAQIRIGELGISEA
jgi:hypothetical protein